MADARENSYYSTASLIYYSAAAANYEGACSAVARSLMTNEQQKRMSEESFQIINRVSKVVVVVAVVRWGAGLLSLC